MKTFLEYVAQDILSRYGTDLSRLTVVFPNKRASLFLNGALARLSDGPLWSPAYITISELFRRHSSLTVADPIKLVCDLYRVYTDVTGFDERLRVGEQSSGMRLDHFYGWGQLLVADFDDIDKNMAPADKVFANLRDIREFDDVSYLSDEQKAIIRKFFSNFSDDHNTLLKQRFLRLWSRMGAIYEAFNSRLAAQGLAYEGALYRRVVEDSTQSPFWGDSGGTYLFVGFNLLQPVERRLFARLMGEGRARFYWDFDHYYMKSEAGYFISQYLSEFPNSLPVTDDRIYRNFQRPKRIDLITAPTEDIQARYVSQWLTPERISADRRTAIVLCNEDLLPTVIHCLPPAVSQVNITTGYPLQQTAAGLLVQRLARDHTPAEIIDHVKELAQEPTAAGDPLTAESLFRTYTLLNRLKGLVDSGDLVVDAITMQKLVQQLVRQTSIPFHGEPAVGLQVMGMLETRNLDFDHLLILSANEGNVPRGLTDSSFIPYSLRRAFGLTTADHKAAIYAYHFNRLLSRAKDVTIVYNNATTDGQTAEMSRYVMQLMVEDTYHDIRRFRLQGGQESQLSSPRPIEKTPDVITTLRSRFSIPSAPPPPAAQHTSDRFCYHRTNRPPLSLGRGWGWVHLQPLLTPTAINRYMRCPLQFYYCYVEGLREPDDTEDGVIDNRTFGNIFHNAAQLLYERLCQKSPRILASDLDALLRSRVDIERAVDEAFAREFRPADGSLPPSGLAVINREVIIHYLRQLVEVDRRLAPFTILQLEADVVQPLTVRSIGITTAIGGRVDRLDLISTDRGELIRVVDYKTGAHRIKYLKTVDDIFDEAQLHNHSDYYLQTMLYARIVSSSFSSRQPSHPSLSVIRQRAVELRSQAEATPPLSYRPPVAPALLFIQHAAAADYNPVLKLNGEYISDVATPDGDRFVSLLAQKIDEMFDPLRPFAPTADTARCRLCPYAQHCGL